LKVVNCKIEGALKAEMHTPEVVDGIAKCHNYQFLKHGYFVVDPDTTSEKLVFNRTASLKDNWQK
jgi:glutaminyl-tRNA synthetase